MRNMRGTCQTAAIAIALALGSPLTVTEAMAQSTARDFRVEAGSLGQALNQFAAQSHVQIIYAPELVQNRTSSGLTGSFAPEDALKALLKGAAIAIEQVNTSTFVLKAMQTKTSTPAKPASQGGMQATQEPKTSEAFATITVTGILAAQEGALSTKRDSNGFVDAINAEDVGKLPDMNVAEALQRVTGVAIQRSRGEGDFISIRGLGPSFVRGEIDGRTLVSSTETSYADLNGGGGTSTGRETNFDLLPAEIISSIEVTKSTSADQVEGGIGGVVNIKTQRPLALGNTTAASFDETYRDFNGKYSPRASALVSWVNADKTFGALGSVAYSERQIREDSTSTYTWIPKGFANNAFTYDTNGDGKSDGSLTTPWVFFPESVNETRKRATAQGSLEWKFADDSHLVVDALYSRRDLNSTDHYGLLALCCGAAVQSPGIPANADGSLTLEHPVLVGSTLVGFDGVSPNSLFYTDTYHAVETLYTLGANYNKMLGDSWELNTDLAYSRSRAENVGTGVGMQAQTSMPYTYFQANQQQVSLGPLPAGYRDPANFDAYSIGNGQITNNDHESSVAASLKRNLSAGFISAVEFGARYSDRFMDRLEYDDSIGGSGPGGMIFNLSGLGPSAFEHGPSDYMGGQVANAFPLGSFLYPNYDQYLSYLKSKNPAASLNSAFNSTTSFAVKEKTTAAFAQADIDTELGGIPIEGDAGIRLVKTDTSATAFFRPFTIIFTPVSGGGTVGGVVYTSPNITPNTIGHSYNNVLPMTNLRAEFTEDLLLRFSAGRSVSRPTFAAMNPVLSSVNPTNLLATAGNPNLKAYLSDNYDLGLEWYFNKGSALYAAVFHKDIHDFIGPSTTTNTTFFGVEWKGLTQPQNQGDASIDGVEVGAQQIFECGLGYVLNATLINSSAAFTSGVNNGKTIPFEGVSKKTYNATVFYEKNGLSARLAWSHRGDYVTISSDVLGGTMYVAPYSQLDASASYEIDKNWSIFANGINLTGSHSLTYVNTRLEPAAYSYVGKRFALGMKLKF